MFKGHFRAKVWDYDMAASKGVQVVVFDEGLVLATPTRRREGLATAAHDLLHVHHLGTVLGFGLMFRRYKGADNLLRELSPSSAPVDAARLFEGSVSIERDTALAVMKAGLVPGRGSLTIWRHDNEGDRKALRISPSFATTLSVSNTELVAPLLRDALGERFVDKRQPPSPPAGSPHLVRDRLGAPAPVSRAPESAGRE